MLEDGTMIFKCMPIVDIYCGTFHRLSNCRMLLTMAQCFVHLWTSRKPDSINVAKEIHFPR